jgi:hypothetical protein
MFTFYRAYENADEELEVLNLSIVQDVPGLSDSDILAAMSAATQNPGRRVLIGLELSEVAERRVRYSVRHTPSPPMRRRVFIED